VRRGRRVWTSFLRLTPVAACRSRATASAANTTGQVGFDRVAVVVEHGLCRCLGYADLWAFMLVSDVAVLSGSA